MEGSSGRFTALEGGARVAAACGTRNTLAVEYAAFISTRLIYEQAYTVRGSLFEGRQRSIHVTRATRVPVVAHELKILTDLAVTQAVKCDDVFDWAAELDKKEVLVCTSSVLRQILEDDILSMVTINVLVLDSCHLVWKDENLRYIMKMYKQCDENNRPRILALTYPLFNSIKKEDSTKPETPVAENTTKHDNDNIEPPDLVENDTESLSNAVEIAEITKIVEIEINAPKIIEIAVSNVPKIVEIDDSEMGTLESNDTIDSESVLAEEDSTEIQDANPQDDTDTTRDEEIDEDVEKIGEYENYDDFDMYEKLEWKIEQLEQELCCQMDLAEDIDGGKRLSATISKPKEMIIEYRKPLTVEQQDEDCAHLFEYMRKTASDALTFLRDHRYDPTEIYGEDMYDEFKNIPDPTIDPKYIFGQFLYVLDQLGPYGADKAAFSLLTKLEKLKIKVPYERHFLLLCVCTSVFVKIRCYADLVFSKYESDWDKIRIFSTPKVLRFAEILEQFQPPDQSLKNTNKDNNKATSDTKVCNDSTRDTNENSAATNENNRIIDENSVNINENSQANHAPKTKINENSINDGIDTSANENISNIKQSKEDTCTEDTKSKTNKMLEAIEKCDFISLSNRIEDRVHIIESNLKEINLINENTINDSEHKINDNENRVNDKGIFSRRSGHRTRGRGRVQRSNAARAQQLQQNPDALCGIVFMKEALMAKIMFMLIVDMSRCCSKLWFLCAQYCAVERPADPANEPRECQRQGKKQEDVLKKFRMHECNLLLATSALEEGIDLPRCNLVIRWDVPASYRSYGLCRSRARAARAACALLSNAAPPSTAVLLHNVATYRELDQIITRKCGCGIQEEPPQAEEDHADCFTSFIKPYTPLDNESNNKPNNENRGKQNNENCDNDSKNKINGDIPSKGTETIENRINDSTDVINEISDNLFCNKCNNKRNSADIECSCMIVKITNFNENRSNDFKKNKNEDSIASVDLNSAIALINRYCGKLPSDTFTRLAPQWWMEKLKLGDRTAYICTLRLPLNCPVKYNIVGHPMPTRVLARRMVALQACRILHKSGELDNQLMPIGKENFKAAELETTGNVCDTTDATDTARPGTTKRRQYYFKRTAWMFTDCQPVVDASDSEVEPPEAIAIEKPDNTEATNIPNTNVEPRKRKRAQ
ncbi:endoribonuclease Dcr-1-like [Hyposmocoma kahamanoa]|uniref:endoribonuclease Dcr-1-like n=1 Tax=Hyposmocoma kahamanoa TaxID=1477025 RepID=UPI000E6D5B95|nr:endoribonuclease Dcr-1-like [Hyposmocoma kahamanoa]